ncbi:hypothetical protein [Pedobacter riviphilus]|nr:hypothetical protein [Pedobacter riviphilus]
MASSVAHDSHNIYCGWSR